MKTLEYNYQDIEEKWQNKWFQDKINETKKTNKQKYFIHFAYPGVSGFLHIGHMRGFTYCDIISRYKRMTGYNVLFPAGFHASGIPSVGYAKKGFLYFCSHNILSPATYSLIIDSVFDSMSFVFSLLMLTSLAYVPYSVCLSANLASGTFDTFCLPRALVIVSKNTPLPLAPSPTHSRNFWYFSVGSNRYPHHCWSNINKSRSPRVISMRNLVHNSLYASES